MVRRLAVSIALVAMTASADEVPAHRPLRPADILNMEDIGRARLARSGSELVYERVPALRQAPNVGALDGSLERSVLAKIYSIDLKKGGEPGPLFDHGPDRSCWIGALSPDSLRLAFYCLAGSRLSAGVFDFTSRRASHFAFTANYIERFNQAPVWISNDEVIYSAIPESEQPEASFRQGIAARLNGLWSRAFTGIEPSITLLRSTADGVTEARKLRTGMLMRVDARSGRETPIASGYFYNLRISPDGRFLAALREGGDVQPPAHEAPAGVERTFRELVVLDLREGTTALPCPDCHVSLGSLNWSAGGSDLTFVGRPLGKAFEQSDLYRYDASRDSLGKIDTSAIRIACGAIRSTMIRTVAVGNDIAIYGNAGPSGEAGAIEFPNCRRDRRQDWLLLSRGDKPHALTSSFSRVFGDLLGRSGSRLFVLADGAVWRLSRSTPPRRMTHGITAPLTPWSVGHEAAYWRSREDAFTSARLPDRYTVLQSEKEIITIDLQRATYTRLERPSADSMLLDVMPAGDLGVFREDTASGTALVVLQAGGPSRVLERLNTQLAHIALPTTATIQHTAPNGAKLMSCVYLPPGWTADRRYPMVIDVYPDMEAGSCDEDYRPHLNPMSLRFLAAHGYVVLSPATPRALIKTDDGPMRALTSVVFSAVDEAVARGYADPERLGVFGFSQGFTSTLQVLTESKRFRAGVVGSGVADFSSHYGTMALRNRLGGVSGGGALVGNFPRYETDNSPMYLDARPWESPTRFAANSPVFHAQHIDAPLLIFHSDFDGFPLGQSEQLFSTLYRLRKDATYVTYWGEGHGNTSPANIEDYWQRVFAWFDDRL